MHSPGMGKWQGKTDSLVHEPASILLSLVRPGARQDALVRATVRRDGIL